MNEPELEKYWKSSIVLSVELWETVIPIYRYMVGFAQQSSKKYCSPAKYCILTSAGT